MSVGLSGPFAAVTTSRGIATVQTFERVGADWQERQPLSVGGYRTYLFGDRFVAVEENGGPPQFDFYRWTVDGFVPTQSVVIDHPSAPSQLLNMAAFGKWLFVSAPGPHNIEEPSRHGVVFALYESSQGWVWRDTIFPSDSAYDDQFGIGMAAQDGVLAVSNSNGVTYFFQVDPSLGDGGSGGAGGVGSGGAAGEAGAGNAAVGGAPGATGQGGVGVPGVGGDGVIQGPDEAGANVGTGVAGVPSSGGEPSPAEPSASGGVVSGSEGGQAATNHETGADAGCSCSTAGKPSAFSVWSTLLVGLGALRIGRRRAAA
jgi:MYXO-CTERM domain-containing protein